MAIGEPSLRPHTQHAEGLGVPLASSTNRALKRYNPDPSLQSPLPSSHIRVHGCCSLLISRCQHLPNETSWCFCLTPVWHLQGPAPPAASILLQKQTCWRSGLPYTAHGQGSGSTVLLPRGLTFPLCSTRWSPATVSDLDVVWQCNPTLWVKLGSRMFFCSRYEIQRKRFILFLMTGL